MKTWIASLITAVAIAVGVWVSGRPIHIEAQSLPYNLTVAWDVSTDAGASYNCYLDGVVQTSVGVGATSCQFPVSSLGRHTVGVTAVDASFIPSESAAATLAFVLGAPAAPSGIKVK